MEKNKMTEFDKKMEEIEEVVREAVKPYKNRVFGINRKDNKISCVDNSSLRNDSRTYNKIMMYIENHIKGAKLTLISPYKEVGKGGAYYFLSNYNRKIVIELYQVFNMDGMNVCRFTYDNIVFHSFKKENTDYFFYRLNTTERIKKDYDKLKELNEADNNLITKLLEVKMNEVYNKHKNNFKDKKTYLSFESAGEKIEFIEEYNEMLLNTIKDIHILLDQYQKEINR